MKKKKIRAAIIEALEARYPLPEFSAWTDSKKLTIEASIVVEARDGTRFNLTAQWTTEYKACKKITDRLLEQYGQMMKFYFTNKLNTLIEKKEPGLFDGQLFSTKYPVEGLTVEMPKVQE